MLTGLIGLVLLIVFLVMADNLGKIKRTLDLMRAENRVNYIKIFNKGELKEYQGKNAEALDCYLEAYYYISKYNPKGKTEKRQRETHWEQVRGKIIALGGTIKEIA